MKKSKMLEQYELETGEIIMQYGDSHFFGYVAWLESLVLCTKPNLTPAQENAYKGSPLRSSHKPIYGVVDAPENAVQPVFHIGDKIRFKSTGTIEKVHYITGGGKFINSVDVNDVEKL